MKILITGASGLLGSTLCEYLKNQGEDVQAFNRNKFSWSDHKENALLLSDFDCIVHAAANTNVEACETAPEICYRDNSLFTERLAIAASQTSCKFIYVSSTGIYGSSKDNQPYTEYDEINPPTHYHNAKWLGERAVNQYCKNALVLRAGWIFGGMPDNPKNFVARRIEEALKTKTNKIYSNSQQLGVPTFVEDFALKFYELLKCDEVGTFNLVNQGAASRFEYVSKIIGIAGLDIEVLPISAGSFNRKAKVSDNETAITLKLTQLGYEPLPHWAKSLERYVTKDLNLWLTEKKNNE